MTSLSLSDEEGGRNCSLSGLRLIASAGELSVRIGKNRYGATGALPRNAGEDRREWSRFDSPGRTLYVAEDEPTAFAEVLADFQLPPGKRFHHLEADATAAGLTIDDFLLAVERERGERGLQYMGYLPASWRDDRRVFFLLLRQDGWLIDIEHPDSIAVLRERCESALEDRSIRVLTTADVRGNDRELTTTFASVLRGIQLDTGLSAAGIHYESKHGGGWCRALWLPDSPAEDDEHVVVAAIAPITAERSGFASTLRRYGIRSY